ncbi:hypothetical protein EV361DRAFT_78094 [Lentinula raphanica]|uniref:TPM domain-containing protein n=1 Tax=Lentinula raphanica TaxID=153919 RepID=A0AA38P299_9AGAR|nr:hypothetical protein F5880DRAFT_1555477 [Lentinula raphanica]KAJ3834896.1 hypothetical protein F5878DRAFT_336561 [Lentinula raphanica]KAJ3973241.1 hypothetical protein EV361DRAFT_78094 [Lentinula raphanica]
MKISFTPLKVSLRTLSALILLLALGSNASPVPQSLSLRAEATVLPNPLSSERVPQRATLPPERRSGTQTGWTPDTHPNTPIKSIESVKEDVYLSILSDYNVAFQIGQSDDLAESSAQKTAPYDRDGAVLGLTVSKCSRHGGMIVGTVEISHVQRDQFWAEIKGGAPYDTKLHLAEAVFEKLAGMGFAQTPHQKAYKNGLFTRIRQLRDN